MSEKSQHGTQERINDRTHEKVYRDCPKCGNGYHVVAFSGPGSSPRRGCGCRVRIVPTIVELEETETATATTTEAAVATDGGADE